MSEDLSRNGAFLDLRDHAAFAATERADQHLDSKNAAQQGGPDPMVAGQVAPRLHEEPAQARQERARREDDVRGAIGARHLELVDEMAVARQREPAERERPSGSVTSQRPRRIPWKSRSAALAYGGLQDVRSRGTAAFAYGGLQDVRGRGTGTKAYLHAVIDNRHTTHGHGPSLHGK
jgi:hypothetical protein